MMHRPATGLDDLRSFFLVAEAGGVSAASRRFGLSKATLSRAISRLEERSGTPLFDRTGTGVRMTRAGEALFDVACQATKAGNRAEEILRGVTEEPSGPLNIAAYSVVGQFFLAPILADIIAEFPKVQPRVIASVPGSDLLEDDVDIALRAGQPEKPHLISRKIGKASMNLYGAEHFAEDFDLQDPASVAKMPRIVVDTPGLPKVWEMEDGHGHSFCIDGEPAAIVTDVSVAVGLVLAGVGIATLPKFMAEMWMPGGDMIEILPEYTASTVDLFAVFPPGRASVPAVRILIDRIVQQIEEYQ